LERRGFGQFPVQAELALAALGWHVDVDDGVQVAVVWGQASAAQAQFAA
jgi:hypothetical protein